MKSPNPPTHFQQKFMLVIKTNRKIYLLLMKCYNLCKVLACLTVFFQLSLSCATFFQLHTFILLISSKTLSSQRVLGLPNGLLDMGFHLLIFRTLLSSAMRSTWHNQFNLSLNDKYQPMHFTFNNK